MKNRPLIIGITGKMGSGKTYVSNKFNKLGAVLFNSDNISKKLQNSNTELKQLLIDKFGEQYYTNGLVNIEYVKKLCFMGDDISKQNLIDINNIISPFFIKYLDSFVQSISTDSYVLLESAILFETGLNKYCDKVISVNSPAPHQAAYTRDFITKEEWDIRMSTQLPDSEKQFDYIIGNDYTSDLDKQIENIHSDILNIIIQSK